ncbi:phage tail protein [Undibacterium jejuense]|uniref:Phage tail protein n=1 Tax=Undibacterium jejuense TaxID=1344949 RepID=A0A923KNE4_9BURK|nr:phage tail protein [Undibacterium jejuense]MBC3860471.1 phage tail protein [Undibacterium jejuense]
MMMSLDQFVFSLPTLAYQEFQRQQEWKHPATSRVGERDAHQYLGEGDDTITLSGWIAPELTGDITSLDDIRDMASRGEAYVLVEGTGRIFGEFVITQLTEGRTLFYTDGMPRRIEFSVSLKRVDRGDQIDAYSGSPHQESDTE